MSGVLCLDPGPALAAAAAVIIPLAVQEDAVPIEAAAGLHLPLLPPLSHPPAGLRLAAIGPGHILAATDTLPVAAAEITIDTGGLIPVSFLVSDSGHAHPPTVLTATITDGITSHGQDPPATEADTVTTEFPDPLPDPSEAGQDPCLQNAPLLGVWKRRGNFWKLQDKMP